MSKVRKLFEDTPPPLIAIASIDLSACVEIGFIRNYGNGLFSKHKEGGNQVEGILPEFEKALNGLVDDLVFDNGLDAVVWKEAKIIKLTFKTPNLGGISAFKAAIQSDKAYSGRTLKYTTAQLPPATLSQEFRDSMDQVIVEAVRFIKGERNNKQGELPLDEVA